MPSSAGWTKSRSQRGAVAQQLVVGAMRRAGAVGRVVLEGEASATAGIVQGRAEGASGRSAEVSDRGCRKSVCKKRRVQKRERTRQKERAYPAKWPRCAHYPPGFSRQALISCCLVREVVLQTSGPLPPLREHCVHRSVHGRGPRRGPDCMLFVGLSLISASILAVTKNLGWVR